MIQFNLLPDVKLKYVKTKRLKHTIILVSIIVSSSLLTILVMLYLLVNVIQKSSINSLNTQLNSGVSTLKNTPKLTDILTLQSQLTQLTSLHDKEVIGNRLLGFIGQITPANASVTDLTITYEVTTGSSGTADQIDIKGTANTLTTFNQFVDILKLCSYQTSTDKTTKNAFTNVSTGTVNYTNTGLPTFEITANFDPILFAQPSSTVVTLNIPSNDVTHSETLQSQDLFVAPPVIVKTNQGN